MPVSLFYVSTDRRVIPQFSLGTRDAFGIKGYRDRARADAGGKVPKNTSRNNCLRFVDLEVAADRLATVIQLFDDAIAVSAKRLEDGRVVAPTSTVPQRL